MTLQTEYIQSSVGDKIPDSITVTMGMIFLHFLFFIFQSYPEIEQKYPPGTVSMLVNSQPPDEDYVMRDGNRVELRVLRPEYWDQIPR